MKIRILLILTSLLLLSSFIFPLWFIKLKAPQYPEGIYLFIYINKLGGQIDLVNGLNHYVGMKKINENAIPELKFMPLIIIFLSSMGLISAILKNRILILMYFILFSFFAILGLWDFYRWEYDYGHNLSPDAPIKIEPFQPPLIGIKQLLNFTIYSFPHISGWLIILAWLILFCVNICYLRFEKATNLELKGVWGIILLTIFSCSDDKPMPIEKDKDICDYCKMVISDLKFAGEIKTKKGKIYKFDDLKCLRSFYKEHKDEIKKVYLIPYENVKILIPAEKAFILKSEKIKGPMGGEYLVFEDENIAFEIRKLLGGKIMKFEEFINE